MRVTGGHVLIQATVKMEACSPSYTPSSIRLLSNIPTRHKPAAEEEEGGRRLEGLRDGGGGLGVSGAEGWGGVCINPSQTDS